MVLSESINTNIGGKKEIDDTEYMLNKMVEDIDKLKNYGIYGREDKNCLLEYRFNAMKQIKMDIKKIATLKTHKLYNSYKQYMLNYKIEDKSNIYDDDNNMFKICSKGSNKCNMYATRLSNNQFNAKNIIIKYLNHYLSKYDYKKFINEQYNLLNSNLKQNIIDNNMERHLPHIFKEILQKFNVDKYILDVGETYINLNESDEEIINKISNYQQYLINNLNLNNNKLFSSTIITQVDYYFENNRLDAYFKNTSNSENKETYREFYYQLFKDWIQQYIINGLRILKNIKKILCNFNNSVKHAYQDCILDTYKTKELSEFLNFSEFVGTGLYSSETKNELVLRTGAFHSMMIYPYNLLSYEDLHKINAHDARFNEMALLLNRFNVNTMESCYVWTIPTTERFLRDINRPLFYGGQTLFYTNSYQYYKTIYLDIGISCKDPSDNDVNYSNFEFTFNSVIEVILSNNLKNNIRVKNINNRSFMFIANLNLRIKDIQSFNTIEEIENWNKNEIKDIAIFNKIHNQYLDKYNESINKFSQENNIPIVNVLNKIETGSEEYKKYNFMHNYNRNVDCRNIYIPNISTNLENRKTKYKNTMNNIDDKYKNYQSLINMYNKLSDDIYTSNDYDNYNFNDTQKVDYFEDLYTTDQIDDYLESDENYKPKNNKLLYLDKYDKYILKNEPIIKGGCKLSMFLMFLIMILIIAIIIIIIMYYNNKKVNEFFKK